MRRMKTRLRASPAHRLPGLPSVGSRLGSPGRGRSSLDVHGDSTLLSVWSFVDDVVATKGPSPATTTAADFSPPSRVFQTARRSPFQARDEISRSKTCVVLRTTAASTARACGCWSFAVTGPLAPPSTPRTRFLSIGPRIRSPLPSRRPRGATLCGSLSIATACFRADSHLLPRRPCSAHQSTGA